MSGRAIIVLAGKETIDRAFRWITMAPPGTRLEFKAAKRTLPQNDKMWSMLTDIAAQKEHCGRKYDTNTWKCIFLHALGREVRFVPALDGEGMIPLMLSSSDLSKEEMSDMIEFMFAWAAENGVSFSDPETKLMEQQAARAA